MVVALKDVHFLLDLRSKATGAPRNKWMREYRKLEIFGYLNRGNGKI